jgi:CheY-like chemotaxis protein
MMTKILVCDDQEIVREVVGGFLQRKGCEVTKVKDGKECLEMIHNQHFDAIFLDVNMPKVDGLAVMTEVRRLKIQTQVIFMSGFDPSHYHGTSADPANGARFLTKPFALDSVLQILMSLKKESSNRILLVDDQDMLREMLGEYLSNKGYQIVEARNGKECVDRLHDSNFAAIFMDVRMPEMDGLEALEKIRSAGNKTPVILMSGYGEVSSVEDALKRGAQNFLAKPFKLEKALEMLHDEGH